MFENELKNMMKLNGSKYELFEIWDNGCTTYGFLDGEGLHYFSKEDQRNFCIEYPNSFNSIINRTPKMAMAGQDGPT